MGIPSRDSNTGRRRAFDDTAAAMIKAAETLVPQEVPPGSGENAVGKGGVSLGRGAGRRGRLSSHPTRNGEKDKEAPAIRVLMAPATLVWVSGFRLCVTLVPNHATAPCPF